MRDEALSYSGVSEVITINVSFCSWITIEDVNSRILEYQ